eukprot:5425090-Amphidinium_carterae.2
MRLGGLQGMCVLPKIRTSFIVAHTCLDKPSNPGRGHSTMYTIASGRFVGKDSSLQRYGSVHRGRVNEGA